MKVATQQFVEEIQDLIDGQLSYLNEIIRPLGEDDLTWRPGQYRWNIYEVVEHLNRFGIHYIPKFEEAVDSPRSLRKKDEFRPGFLGKYAIKQIRPVNGVIPNKTKSPSKANPFLRQLDRSVFDDHAQQQDKLKYLLKNLGRVNLNRNSVSTIAIPFLRFSLGDSIRILSYHAERHYVQLDNLVNKRID